MTSIGRGKSGELSETQEVTEAIRISQSPHVMNQDQEAYEGVPKEMLVLLLDIHVELETNKKNTFIVLFDTYTMM